MNDMLIEEGTITFSFKMKKPTSVKNVINMVSNFGTSNSDSIDTTAVSYEEPVKEIAEKPSKPHRVTHKREYIIDGERMDMYELGEELYPGEDLTRRQKYRKVGGVLERDFRLPNGEFDNVGFAKHMTKEVRKARAIKNAVKNNSIRKNF